VTSSHDPHELVGSTVYDNDGNQIGRIGHVYLDPETRAVAWATVYTGHREGRESFAPLDEARRDSDGRLRLPYLVAHIEDAPAVDPEERIGVLPTKYEANLSRYYGMYQDDPNA
jgi:sporulation protein YlmC with PRC-barrel domain